MIEIIARNGAPEAMLCPAFICDACREQIVGQGNVISKVRYDGDQRQTSPLLFAHKGQCTQAVDAWLNARYLLTEGWSMIWDELGDFVRQLSHNLTHAFADDPEGEYLSHQLIEWAGP